MFQDLGYEPGCYGNAHQRRNHHDPNLFFPPSYRNYFKLYRPYYNTSCLKGLTMASNRFPSVGAGIKAAIRSTRKGLVKSTTVQRASVGVRGKAAISASYNACI